MWYFSSGWIESQKMNAFLTVGQSSSTLPKFLEINYRGAPPTHSPVLLAGEGTIFTTGGLCLKRDENLAEYRGSMAGAAVLIAAIRAAAELPMNITGLVPICENMVSGMAIRPGDVITSYTCKNINVDNSDNAAALIMADTLSYGLKTYKPRTIISIAATSNEIRSALRNGYTWTFTGSVC